MRATRRTKIGRMNCESNKRKKTYQIAVFGEFFFSKSEQSQHFLVHFIGRICTSSGVAFDVGPVLEHLPWSRNMEGERPCKVLDLMGDFSRVTFKIEDCDRSKVKLTAAVVEDWSSWAINTDIREYPDAVHMKVFLSDGWSCMVSQTFTAQVDGELVRRKGRRRQEFLLQRVIQKCALPNGRLSLRMKFVRPRPLTRGRCHWNVFTAARETSGYMREEGANNICVNVLLNDGHMFEALSRAWEADGCLFYKRGRVLEDSEYPADVAEAMDWWVGVKCRDHSGSNGIKHGVTHFADEESVDDLHISIASLQGGSSDLHEMIDTFIHSRVVARKTHTGTPEEGMKWWQAMGVEPNMLDLFVQFDLLVEGNLLTYHESMWQREDYLDDLRACFLYTQSWLLFSLTRWGKVGSSGRKFGLSVSCGIDEVWQLCKDGGASQAKLCGWSQASTSLRFFTVFAHMGRRMQSALLQYTVIQSEGTGRYN